MKQTFKGFLLALAAMFVGGGLSAQVTTSSLGGRIVDEANEPLAGAAVIAVHTPSGTQYAAVANDEGRYVINGMRSGGPYSVEISFIGMSTIEFQDVTLKLGEQYQLDAVMQSANELDAVVVVSEGAFNASKTGAGASFSLSAVENMPTIDRSIYDVVKYTPQASVNKSGGISFAGSNNRYNSFRVDGAVANDSFGLASSGTNGGQTGANPISLDAIEEIYWPISKWGRHHIILKDGSLSFNNVSLPQKDTSDTRRLELRDTAGDLISAYDKFPAIDEEWKRDMMYINDYVAVSPDEEKFAVVTSLGGILETFSIKDGELKNIATKYFVEPDFSMTKSKVGEVYSVSYDYDNLVKSFGDLYVTNDAVYAVYGGDRMFTSRTGSDNIAVFDWKGNPQKLIRTDYRIVTFFLDEEENTVYAVIWDSEMRPYIGRIRI